MIVIKSQTDVLRRYKIGMLSNITDLNILPIYRNRVIFIFLINSVYDIMIDISTVETTERIHC